MKSQGISFPTKSGHPVSIYKNLPMHGSSPGIQKGGGEGTSKSGSTPNFKTSMKYSGIILEGALC